MKRSPWENYFSNSSCYCRVDKIEPKICNNKSEFRISTTSLKLHIFEFQNSLHWELGTCLSIHVLSLFCFLSNKICVTHDVCICRSINNFLCLSFPMRNNPISVRTNLNQHNICVHPEGENNAYNIRLLISSIRKSYSIKKYPLSTYLLSIDSN